MIAIECLKCGGTSYTADPVSINPCPYCGTAAIERIMRSLTDRDRLEDGDGLDDSPRAS